MTGLELTLTTILALATLGVALWWVIRRHNEQIIARARKGWVEKAPIEAVIGPLGKDGTIADRARLLNNEQTAHGQDIAHLRQILQDLFGLGTTAPVGMAKILEFLEKTNHAAAGLLQGLIANHAGLKARLAGINSLFHPNALVAIQEVLEEAGAISAERDALRKENAALKAALLQAEENAKAGLTAKVDATKAQLTATGTLTEQVGTVANQLVGGVAKAVKAADELARDETAKGKALKAAEARATAATARNDKLVEMVLAGALRGAGQPPRGQSGGNGQPQGNPQQSQPQGQPRSHRPAPAAAAPAPATPPAAPATTTDTEDEGPEMALALEPEFHDDGRFGGRRRGGKGRGRDRNRGRDDERDMDR